jgi:HEAT repeat protein
MMFKKTSIALFVFTVGLAPLWAVTPEQLEQLAGKSTDNIPASQYAEVCRDAMTHLTAQMDQTKGDARYAHQVMLQNICFYASRLGAEPQRLAMSTALVNTLQSKTLTREMRYWVLLQIERTGKAEALSALTESLGSADKIEQSYARAALEKNPAPQATDILLEALAAARDETFAAGLISSLGSRQDPKSVEAIGKQLDRDNHTIAAAAVTSLVKINTPDAVMLLKQKLSPTHPAAGAIAKGLVDIAALSAASQANPIYEQLYAWSDKVKPAFPAYSIRKAALIGLAKNDFADVNKMILADFDAEDTKLKSMAIAAAAVAKSSSPANRMADNSDHLDSTLQGQLIVMLTGRHEPSVITPARRAVKSGNPDLLWTAIDALSQTKTRESAVLLLETAGSSDARISRYARKNIIEADNAQMDAMLRAEADSGNDTQRATAIILLGERKTPNVTEQLFKYAQSDNEVIYTSALQAIGSSALPDNIPLLCSMVKKSTAANFKASAISAINQILRNSHDKKTAYAIILEQIETADEDQKVNLISTLKMSDNAEAMEYCLGLLSDAEGKSFESPIPQAALKMLSYWSDPMPAKPLLERAKTSQHKSAYAQAAVDLAKNLLRYDKEQAKKIARDVKALNVSEAINQSANKIINLR